MRPDQWQRAKQVLYEAIEREPDRRAEFLLRHVPVMSSCYMKLKRCSRRTNKRVALRMSRNLRHRQKNQRITYRSALLWAFTRSEGLSEPAAWAKSTKRTTRICSAPSR